MLRTVLFGDDRKVIEWIASVVSAASSTEEEDPGLSPPFAVGTNEDNGRLTPASFLQLVSRGVAAEVERAERTARPPPSPKQQQHARPKLNGATTPPKRESKDDYEAAFPAVGGDKPKKRVALTTVGAPAVARDGAGAPAWGAPADQKKRVALTTVGAPPVTRDDGAGVGTVAGAIAAWGAPADQKKRVALTTVVGAPARKSDGPRPTPLPATPTLKSSDKQQASPSSSSCSSRTPDKKQKKKPKRTTPKKAVAWSGGATWERLDVLAKVYAAAACAGACNVADALMLGGRLASLREERKGHFLGCRILAHLKMEALQWDYTKELKSRFIQDEGALKIFEEQDEEAEEDAAADVMGEEEVASRVMGEFETAPQQDSRRRHEGDPRGRYLYENREKSRDGLLTLLRDFSSAQSDVDSRKLRALIPPFDEEHFFRSWAPTGRPPAAPKGNDFKTLRHRASAVVRSVAGSNLGWFAQLCDATLSKKCVVHSPGSTAAKLAQLERTMHSEEEGPVATLRNEPEEFFFFLARGADAQSFTTALIGALAFAIDRDLALIKQATTLIMTSRRKHRRTEDRLPSAIAAGLGRVRAKSRLAGLVCCAPRYDLSSSLNEESLVTPLPPLLCPLARLVPLEDDEDAFWRLLVELVVTRETMAAFKWDGLALRSKYVGSVLDRLLKLRAECCSSSSQPATLCRLEIEAVLLWLSPKMTPPVITLQRRKAGGRPLIRNLEEWAPLTVAARDLSHKLRRTLHAPSCDMSSSSSPRRLTAVLIATVTPPEDKPIISSTSEDCFRSRDPRTGALAAWKLTSLAAAFFKRYPRLKAAAELAVDAACAAAIEELDDVNDVGDRESVVRECARRRVGPTLALLAPPRAPPQLAHMATSIALQHFESNLLASLLADPMRRSTAEPRPQPPATPKEKQHAVLAKSPSSASSSSSRRRIVPLSPAEHTARRLRSSPINDLRAKPLFKPEEDEEEE